MVAQAAAKKDDGHSLLVVGVDEWVPDGSEAIYDQDQIHGRSGEAQCLSSYQGSFDLSRSACVVYSHASISNIEKTLGRVVRVPLGESKASAPRHPGGAGKAAKQAAQHERANTSRLSEAGTTRCLYLLATPLLSPPSSSTTATMNVIKLQKCVFQCAPPYSIRIGAVPPPLSTTMLTAIPQKIPAIPAGRDIRAAGCLP